MKDLKLSRLMALAFDPAAAEGEATNAFLAARRLVIRQGIHFSKAFEGCSELDNSPVFPFGKYKGQEVLEVAKRDMAYLQWFAHNVTNQPELSDYIKKVLEKYYQL